LKEGGVDLIYNPFYICRFCSEKKEVFWVLY
jgi:hypothetical protein